LGVRYVLEGSVQRSGNRVRVNAQLINAENDAHLWAERFDHDTGDLFALQNQITSRIAVALNVEVLAAEVARGTEDNPDALDYILQGRAALAQPPGLDSYVEAINAFEHALALDPQSIEAKGWLANALVGRVLDLHPSSSWSDLKHADTLARQALTASPRSPLALFVKGQLLRVEGRCDEAIPEFEMVIASNRNLRPRRVQAANGIDRRGNPVGGAGSPPWPPRSLRFQPLSRDWQGAFAAIAR